MIELKNIEAYRGNNHVLSDITLAINAGECVAILGPNGSGKSTLLKLLSREIYPVQNPESSLRLFGDELIDIWQLRKKMGFVSADQQAEFQTMDTGLDIVVSAYFGSLGIHTHHFPTEEQRQMALDVMRNLDIESLKDRPFCYLSSGQQRRLLLARALVHKPSVLVFDEPTSNLDITSAVKLLNDMRRLASQGLSIILVTHHIQEIIPEITRVVGLQEGKILFDQPKADALSSENLSGLFKTALSVSEQNGYFQWVPC